MRQKVGGRMIEALKNYQPETESLRNFGVDISRKAVEQYALKEFGRVPETELERRAAMEAKIMGEIRGAIGNEHGRSN